MFKHNLSTNFVTDCIAVFRYIADHVTCSSLFSLIDVWLHHGQGVTEIGWCYLQCEAGVLNLSILLFPQELIWALPGDRYTSMSSDDNWQGVCSLSMLCHFKSSNILISSMASTNHCPRLLEPFDCQGLH